MIYLSHGHSSDPTQGILRKGNFAIYHLHTLATGDWLRDMQYMVTSPWTELIWAASPYNGEFYQISININVDEYSNDLSTATIDHTFGNRAVTRSTVDDTTPGGPSTKFTTIEGFSVWIDPKCTCAPNTYQSAGCIAGVEPTCSPCPDNTESPGGTTPPITKCKAKLGYIGRDGTAAKQCTAGNYCPAGSTQQNQCAPGYYCPTSSSQLPCTLGNYCPSGSAQQNPCQAGYYCPNTQTQTICPKGSSCLQGISAHTL